MLTNVARGGVALPRYLNLCLNDQRMPSVSSNLNTDDGIVICLFFISVHVS